MRIAPPSQPMINTPDIWKRWEIANFSAIIRFYKRDTRITFLAVLSPKWTHRVRKIYFASCSSGRTLGYWPNRMSGPVPQSPPHSMVAGAQTARLSMVDSCKIPHKIPAPKRAKRPGRRRTPRRTSRARRARPRTHPRTFPRTLRRNSPRNRLHPNLRTSPRYHH